MLGHTFPRRSFRTITYGGRPSGNTGVNVGAGAAPHTLSAAFVELVAALPFPIHWISRTSTGSAPGPTATDALLTPACDTAGQETFWIRGLLAGWSGAIGTD